MIKSGFVEAKILDETIGELNKPKDACFRFMIFTVPSLVVENEPF